MSFVFSTDKNITTKDNARTHAHTVTCRKLQNRSQWLFKGTWNTFLKRETTLMTLFVFLRPNPFWKGIDSKMKYCSILVSQFLSFKTSNPVFRRETKQLVCYLIEKCIHPSIENAMLAIVALIVSAEEGNVMYDYKEKIESPVWAVPPCENVFSCICRLRMPR